MKTCGNGCFVVGEGGSGGSFVQLEPIAVRDMRDGQWSYGVGARVDLSELTKEIQADGFPFNLEAQPWAHGLGWSLLVAVGLATVAARWADRGVVVVPTRPPEQEDVEDDSDNVIQL